MVKDWIRNVINEVIDLKREMAEVDNNKIWEYHMPGKPATEEEIMKAEICIGCSLDSDYRSFLSQVNGWKCFKQNIDLFGTVQLCESSELVRAKELIGYLESEGSLLDSGFKINEVTPIAVSRHNLDVFLMSRIDSHSPGIVIWFAGYEIERYDSFVKFMEKMVEYNRSNLDFIKTNY